ncbi:MAG: rod shape-determining protein MreD [Muribaculaceae bacterium]|nr:rod shape-determining protein MreD [Muribaculaceae bacterium]
MSKTILQFMLIFIVMVLLQVSIFNHICLYNIAIPFVFIYFIIRLPITLSTNWVLTFSFFLGLAVDIFSDTQGMHSLSCTILAMLRRRLLRLYVPRDEDISNPEPSIRSLGLSIYLKYLITVVLTYCLTVFTIEACTFFNILQLITRILGSSTLTILFILGLDSLTIQRREKRL